ncbi:MAG: N-acetylmuramoyl-L-alanine amidase [Phycisphaerales bacterium]|nr:N-acetylmuramoyl-L-alanine amidase [Phycisphaerales bacterium]
MINDECSDSRRATCGYRSHGRVFCHLKRHCGKLPWVWTLLAMGLGLVAVAAGHSRLAHHRIVVIAIDPGHGGRDPGAVSHGLQEKNITLAIAKDVAALIDRHGGLQAVLTRHNDHYVGLLRRVAIARQAGAQLFISIHADAGKPSWDWATVYTQEHDRTALASDRLADEITASLRRIERTDHDRHANFVVLREARVPAVLIETGYITNTHQAHELASARFQHRIAQAVFRGIESYLSQK